MKSIKLTPSLSFVALAAGLLLPLYASSQTVTLLHQFSESDSGNASVMNPQCDLVLSNGYLYGTVTDGGANNCGMIFAVKTDGSGFRVIHNLNDGNINVTSDYDGDGPLAGLTMSGNTLYGTCSGGGVSNDGTVFAVNTNGTFEVIHAFAYYPTDGMAPNGQMVLANGVLYGVTTSGGTTASDGTVFAFDLASSTLSTFFSFSRTDSANGALPVGRLALTNGVLYGVTDDTEDFAFKGTVYSIPTNGTAVTTLHKFTGSTGSSEGARPQAGLLVHGPVLYGTTAGGGTNGYGAYYFINFAGSNYKSLYNFGAFAGDGTVPTGDLVASNAVLYGTTSGGGGTIFWGETVGFPYDSICFVGDCGGVVLPPTPTAGFVMDTNGVLYGTTLGDPTALVPTSGSVFSIIP